MAVSILLTDVDTRPHLQLQEICHQILTRPCSAHLLLYRASRRSGKLVLQDSLLSLVCHAYAS